MVVSFFALTIAIRNEKFDALEMQPVPLFCVRKSKNKNAFCFIVLTECEFELSIIKFGNLNIFIAMGSSV